ncbi:hypothetical protein [Halomarina rubra]|uniref:Transcriptional regulator n=1 Tax=Halomarina rubra TaxID=2071873 RepID=A0ABD6AVT0_9EURY|nr:hypothetical protein [Halomarina rubra]
MTDEDKSHHPRLMVLHESGGHIEGRAKFHKLLYKYRGEEDGRSSIEQIREERGPFDPGLSKAMQRYVDLGIVEVDESDEPHKIGETEKGERYMSGFERTKSRLDSKFARTKEFVADVVDKHGGRSARDIVQDEDVQEDKDNPYGKEL